MCLYIYIYIISSTCTKYSKFYIMKENIQLLLFKNHYYILLDINITPINININYFIKLSN